MASHHYPHHHQHHHCYPTSTTTTTVGYCCYTNCTPSHHPPVQVPVLDSYHPHYHHPSPQTHFYNPYPNGPILNPNPPHTSQSLHHPHHQETQHHSLPTALEKERYFQQVHHNQQTGELAHDHPIVTSLLRRIAALESSLPNHSSTHAHSLRDTAARTIQTHFRAFLVRRSRTLRQLKELASIKSTLNVLKSSVSENTHFDPQSLSHKASKLLFKLDAIQGGDPMIRDGKRSISRELTRFLDLIDGFTHKSSEISTRLVKKNVVHKKTGGLYGDRNRGMVRCHDLGNNKSLEDLVSRVDALYDKIPEQEDEGDEILECHDIPTIKRISNSTNDVQAKVKKSVRFAENLKVCKGSRNGYQTVKGDYGNGDESDSLGAKGELKDNYTRKAGEVGGISFTVTEDDEEDQSHDGESTKSSDDEGGPASEVRREDGSFVFSAPLPVTMCPRTDPVNRRKIVK